jgi:hypothetical protein
MDALPVIVPLSLILIYAVGWFFYFKSSGLKALSAWAKANGYEIVNSRMTSGVFSPFWFSGRLQRIFHIVVKTKDGKYQSAWVRLGGRLTGLLSDKVEIKWGD